MNDLQLLLAAVESASALSLESVMATVVKVDGSAYRRPGARMIIPQSGNAVGTVSGGCLERDVQRKAWWFTNSGSPLVRSYTTGVNDEDLEEAELSFGLGCNGTVDILFERISLRTSYLALDILSEVSVMGKPAALATVIANEGKTGLQVGDRMAIGVDGQLRNSLLDPVLSAQIEVDLGNVVVTHRSAHHQYTSRDGHSIEVFHEYIPARRRLVVFGAGHDAVPLVDIASLQGWQVFVVDARSNFARKDRFPAAEDVFVLPITGDFGLDHLLADAAVVVMTHSFSQDRCWLEHTLRGTPRYIGQLGPRSRTERLLADMPAAITSGATRNALHFPVGLDIGGDTPAAVALSICSEINAVFSERKGGMLRHRIQSIHTGERSDDAVVWSSALSPA
jgi:xanthine/CO dehydrogenase XdhC/CoxF family maturation factor